MARPIPAPPDGYVFAYPPHPKTGVRVPNARQALAHMCPADELFYGGVRGGGKTEFLGTDFGDAALKFPGIRMLLVRKTREEMKSNIVPVFKRIYRDIARWSRADHSFLFFNGGELIVDFMTNEEDIARYLGSEFGLIGVDQAEQLAEYTVLGLSSCLRSTRPWPKKLRLTGNPGLGVGVAWLRRRYVRPQPAELGDRRAPRPCELWRPLPRPGDPTPPEQVPTRCFIPARYEDNEALVAGDPLYKARIYQAFTINIARAQAEGDWDANDATIVGPLWKDDHTVTAELQARYPDLFYVGQRIDWHVIRNSQWRPPKGAMIFGSHDWGFNPYSFHLHATLPNGHTRTFLEAYQSGKREVEQAAAMRELLTRECFAGTDIPLMEGLQWIVYDPIIEGSRLYASQAKTIIEVFREELPQVIFRPGSATRAARMSRPGRWLDALSTAPDGFPWWSVTTACPELIRTVVEVPRDPDDPDVEDDASENHAYEDTGRFFEARPHAPRVAPVDPFAHLKDDPISHAHQVALAKRHDQPKGGSLGGLAKR